MMHLFLDAESLFEDAALCRFDRRKLVDDCVGSNKNNNLTNFMLLLLLFLLYWLIFNSVEEVQW